MSVLRLERDGDLGIAKLPIDARSTEGRCGLLEGLGETDRDDRFGLIRQAAGDGRSAAHVQPNVRP